jgi:ubiquitin-activating enzyme E1
MKLSILPESELNQNQIKNYDLVILTDFWDQNLIYQYNIFCREQKKPIGFIHCGILGLFLFSFVDFGNGFKIYDKDGLETKPYLIQNISKSNPGVVTLLKEQKHEFVTGDFIKIQEVEGMTEVNGTDTRPIKVIDQYRLS